MQVRDVVLATAGLHAILNRASRDYCTPAGSTGPTPTEKKGFGSGIRPVSAEI